jgi:hypothetical protein
MRMIGLQHRRAGNSIQTTQVLTEIDVHFTMHRTQATMAWPTHKDTKNYSAAFIAPTPVQIMQNT